MITKCNIKNSIFQAPKGRKINFNGGNISSEGGSFLLSLIDKKLGLTSKIAKKINKFDNRCQKKVKHRLGDMLKQRVYGIATGHEDLNDHDTLNSDIALQTAIGLDKKLASSPTLCRFENGSHNKEMCEIISQEIVENFIESFTSPPKKLILDFDATDDLVHGNQEGKFFHGYYKNYCWDI